MRSSRAIRPRYLLQNTAAYSKKIHLKIAGRTYVASFDVADDCVQVTHKGRRSIWTELGGSRPEDVARMLLKELLACS